MAVHFFYVGKFHKNPFCVVLLVCFGFFQLLFGKKVLYFPVYVIVFAFWQVYVIQLKLHKPENTTLSCQKAVEKTQNRREGRHKTDFYETSLHKRNERPCTKRN